MNIDGSTVSAAYVARPIGNYNSAPKINKGQVPLFAYMNAGLSIPKDGTSIAYMNASNSTSVGSGSGSTGGGSTICIA